MRHASRWTRRIREVRTLAVADEDHTDTAIALYRYKGCYGVVWCVYIIVYVLV